MEQFNNSRALHPLEYDMILVQIFDYCSVEMLKQCRLVNKLWCVTCLDIWRAKAVLRVFATNDTEEYQNKGIKLAELLKYVDNPSRERARFQIRLRPFKNMEVVNFAFPTSQHSLQQLFWQHFGPRIEHLTINNSTVTYGRALWVLFHNMANLTSLWILDSLVDGRQEASPHRGYTATDRQIRENRTRLETLTQLRRIKELRIRSQNALGFIVRILQRFPCLEDLTLSDRAAEHRFSTGRRWVIPARNIFRTFRLERDRGGDRLGSIKRLNIMDVWEDAVRDFQINVNYEEFINCNFSLTHLSIDLGENSTQRAIKATLDKNANTLRVLKGFRSPTYGPYIHSFPFGAELPHLREMYLWGYVVHNFGFLIFMPNLKTLSINLACHDMEYKLKNLLRKRFLLMWSEDIVANTEDMLLHHEMDREPISPNLESLYIDHNFPPSSWIQLRKWLPNLCKLSTILNPSTILVVAKLWPRLGKLEMLFGSDIGSEDKMITTLGILQDLTDFKMETYCCRSIITDLSVYEGLLPLPYLEWIDICVSQQFTNRAERDLKEKLGVHRVKIVRNYGKHNERCCARAEYNCRCIPPDPPKEEPSMTRSGRIRNPERI